MAQTIERACRLYGATRLRNTVNGNPRFKLHTSEGDFTIQSDASVSYEVTNYTNRVPGDGSGLPIILKLTRSQRFWDIREGE